MVADFSKHYLHDQLVLLDGLTTETDWSKARFKARLEAMGATASDDWSMYHMIMVELPEAIAVQGITTTTTTSTTTTTTTTEPVTTTTTTTTTTP